MHHLGASPAVLCLKIQHQKDIFSHLAGGTATVAISEGQQNIVGDGLVLVFPMVLGSVSLSYA